MVDTSHSRSGARGVALIAGGVIRGTIPGRVIPYVRVGREKHTPRATRYFADRDRVFAVVHDAARRAGFNRFPLEGRYCLEAIAHFTPAGPTARDPGGYSETDGDADNIAKAIADHLEPSKTRIVGIIGNDSGVISIRGTKRLISPGDAERVQFALAWGNAAEELAAIPWIIE